MQVSPRKGVAFGFGVVAAFLVVASTAFACTIYAGRFTVTGTSTGRAVGSGGSMSYCTDPNLGTNPTSANVNHLASPTFSASAAAESGHSTKYRGCNAALNPSSQVGLYDINYALGSVTGDCMTGSSGTQLVGTGSVNSAGTMTTTNYTGTLATGSGGVCISTNAAWNATHTPVGNQVPVVVS